MLHINKTHLGMSLLLMGSSACFPNISNAASDLEIGGLIEVEVSSGEDHEAIKSSDITLATAAFAINATINEKVSATLVVLHEDDSGVELAIDEGVIHIDIGNGLAFNVGRMYVPFGVFETNMVSDPLTHEIAETQEAALQVAYEAGSFSSSVYVFNGEADEAGVGNDKVDDFGFSLNYALNRGDVNLNLGVGYKIILQIRMA